MTWSEWESGSEEEIKCWLSATAMTTLTLVLCTNDAMGVRWWMDNMLFLVDYRSLNWLLINWMAIAWTHKHRHATHSHIVCTQAEYQEILYYICAIVEHFKMIWIAEILWAKIFTVPSIQSVLLLLLLFPIFSVCLSNYSITRAHTHPMHLYECIMNAFESSIDASLGNTDCSLHFTMSNQNSNGFRFEVKSSK